jgi:hypothetical protein
MPPGEFKALMEDAIELLAKVNPEAAADYQDLLDGTSEGWVSEEVPTKDGEVITVGVAGRYVVIPLVGGGVLVNISISVYGKPTPWSLVGALLHEWMHWKGDMDYDGVLDGDDGTNMASEPPIVPEGATQDVKDKYKKHAEIQYEVAESMCVANCDHVAQDPLGVGLYPCGVILEEFESAKIHYIFARLVDDFESIDLLTGSLEEMCCCTDIIPL